MSDGDQPPNAVIDHATTPPQVLCRECAYASVEDSEAIEELSDDQIGEVCICSSCGRDIADILEEDVVTDGGENVDESGRGDHHLDEREPLAYVYDGETLIAVLYDRRMVASITGNEDAVSDAFGVATMEVSLTPIGEEVIAHA